MRYELLLILIACMTTLSCKKDTPSRPAPEDGRASATQPAAIPATAPSPNLATQPVGGSITESQLLQFISVSQRLMPRLRSAGRVLQPSPEEFRNLSIALRDDEGMKASLVAAGIPPDEWIFVGTRSWSAWSVAQIDYNAEAPLCDNTKRLAEAREKLTVAEATVKSGVREMSPQERTDRVVAAHDAITNANDRAELWAQKAADLRDQIGAAEGIARRSTADEPPAIAVARADALGSARAAQAAMSQELAVAERNERQARDDGRRAEESARHPEQPLNDTEKSDLFRQSRQTIEQARLDIDRLQQEEKLLQARLRDDRRVNAEEGRKAGLEADIALLRKHLAEFNDAWGMTVEGRNRNEYP